MKKNAFKSKTLWSALIVALAGFYEPARLWVQEYPEAYGALIGVVFAYLRTVTNKSLSI